MNQSREEAKDIAHMGRKVENNGIQQIRNKFNY